VAVEKVARCRVWKIGALAEKGSIEMDSFFVVSIIETCVFDLGTTFAFT